MTPPSVETDTRTAAPKGAPLHLHILPALLALVLIVLAGVAVLVIDAISINHNLERVRAAQSDNTTWLISQIEVDLLKLQSATSTAITLGPSADRLAEVRTQYDILYSRTAVIQASMQHVGWFGSDKLRDEWRVVNDLVTAQAGLVDLPDDQLGPRLPELLNQIVTHGANIRTFSIDALMKLVETTTLERQSLQGLLDRFGRAALLLIGLLVATTVVMILLLRRLQQRAEANERIKSNLEKTIEASLDALIVADGAGRILRYNHAAEAIFGHSRTDAIGQDVTDLFLPQRMRDAHRTAIRRFVASGKGSIADRGRLMLTALHKDGHEFPVEVAIMSDRNSEGQMTLFAFVRDISDRVQVETSLKRARDAALRNEEAKTRFLAVMSHEMRTPLNGLIAALDIVTETTRLTKKQQHFLRLARSCSLSALEQINDVLELTRLSQHGPQEEAQPFDVIGLILEIAEQNRPMAEQRGNKLTLDLPEGTPAQVMGVRRLFGRALTNLLGNAVKFTDSGTIVVKARLTAPEADGHFMIRVSITDTGIGIPSDKLDRIFENFETLDSSYTRSAEGTGLGLGIAKRAVEHMGGQIGVISTLGEGSTFWFTARLTLPAGAQGPAISLPAPGSDTHIPLPDGPLDILVAEDNAVNRVVMREMLEHLGHSVTEAENGAQAITEAGASHFDLILMDISMPEVDGLQATREIRRGGPSSHTRIVGLTAHALPEELKRFEEEGLDHVLLKPLTLARLKEFLAPIPRRAVPASGAAAAPRPAAPLQDTNPVTQVTTETNTVTDPGTAPVATSGPLLDLPAFSDLQDVLGEERLRDAIARFEAEALALLTVMQEARTEPAPLAAQAHRLAGSAAVLGARRMHGLLGKIEDAGKAGQTVPGGPLHAALRIVWDDTRQMLDEALSQ